MPFVGMPFAPFQNIHEIENIASAKRSSGAYASCCSQLGFEC